MKKGLRIEFDVTLQCNFSCVNCNRHSNFNDVKNPFDKDDVKGIDLYENTDVTLDKVREFIEDVKKNGTVERIHLIGGEPLVHPRMGEICDLIRDELLGIHVPEIRIISNMHPKTFKAGVMDTPIDMLRSFPFERMDSIEIEFMTGEAKEALPRIKKILDDNPHVTMEMILSDEAATNQILSAEFKQWGATVEDFLLNTFMFHGIGVTNFKPLSAKHEDHRCTLVAPYDSGQEVIETCDHPTRCGVNYSFDGYWPCSNGSAIARLFKLDQYNRQSLPDSVHEWDGMNEDGHAIVKSDGMWDLCKLCQVAAKHPLPEKIYGRPISISYRKAMGMEGQEPISELVVLGHKKKLAKSKRLRDD